MCLTCGGKEKDTENEIRQVQKYFPKSLSFLNRSFWMKEAEETGRNRKIVGLF